MDLSSWSSNYAAAVQALAAIGQGLLTVVALVVAIWVPWWQQKRARAEDDRKAALELAGLRQALHTEVGMIAFQCLLELDSWIKAAPPPAPKNLRTARLPPLAIYGANAGKIGLLTRDEIVHLIGFTGTLHDISIVVDDMARREVQSPNDRQIIQLLLSNACGHADNFLKALPGIPGAEHDRPFIADLRAAYQRMAGFRAKQPPSFQVHRDGL